MDSIAPKVSLNFDGVTNWEVVFTGISNDDVGLHSLTVRADEQQNDLIWHYEGWTDFTFNLTIVANQGPYNITPISDIAMYSLSEP